MACRKSIFVLCFVTTEAIRLPFLQQLLPREVEHVQVREPPTYGGDDPWASWSGPDPYGYGTLSSSESMTLVYGYPSAEPFTEPSTSELSTEANESPTSWIPVPTTVVAKTSGSDTDATSSQLAMTGSGSRSADTGGTKTTDGSNGSSHHASSATRSWTSSHQTGISRSSVSGSHSVLSYLNSSLVPPMTYTPKTSTKISLHLTNEGPTAGGQPTESDCLSCHIQSTTASENPETYLTKTIPSPDTSFTPLGSRPSTFLPGAETAPLTSDIRSSNSEQTKSLQTTVTATAHSVTTLMITSRKSSSGSGSHLAPASTHKVSASWPNGTSSNTSSSVGSSSQAVGNSSTSATSSSWITNIPGLTINPASQDTIMSPSSSSPSTRVLSPITITPGRFPSHSIYSPSVSSIGITLFNASSTGTHPSIIPVNSTSLLLSSKTVLTPNNGPPNITTTHTTSTDVLISLNTTITGFHSTDGANMTIEAGNKTRVLSSSTGLASASQSTTLSMFHNNSSSPSTWTAEAASASGSVSPTVLLSMTVNNTTTRIIHSPTPPLSTSGYGSTSRSTSSSNPDISTVSVLWPPPFITTTISGTRTIIIPNITIFRHTSSRITATEDSKSLDATAGHTTEHQLSHVLTVLPSSTWNNASLSAMRTVQTGHTLLSNTWNSSAATFSVANISRVSESAMRLTRVTPVTSRTTFIFNNSHHVNATPRSTATVLTSGHLSPTAHSLSTTLLLSNVSSALAWSAAPSSLQIPQISLLTTHSTSLVSAATGPSPWTNSTCVTCSGGYHHGNSTFLSATITLSVAPPDEGASEPTMPFKSSQKSQAMSTPCATITSKPTKASISRSTCSESSTEVDEWGCSTICTTTTVDSGTWSHCRTIYSTPQWPPLPFTYSPSVQDATRSYSGTCNETFTRPQQGAAVTAGVSLPTTLVTSTTSTSARDPFNRLSLIPAPQHTSLESPWGGTGHRHKNDTEINEESAVDEMLEKQEWWTKWHNTARGLIEGVLRLRQHL